MYQLAEHICLYLEANGIGNYSAESGNTIFRNQLPTEPDKCVMVADIGGKPLLTASTVAGNFFNFNITVRGKKGESGYDSAQLLANEIYELLKLKLKIVVETVTYYNIRAVTDVKPAGMDKNRRPHFFIAFTGLYTT